MNLGLQLYLLEIKKEKHNICIYIVDWKQVSHLLTKTKHGSEKCIADFKHKEDRMRLLVVLNPHCQHVQEYQHEYSYLKPAT